MPRRIQEMLAVKGDTTSYCLYDLRWYFYFFPAKHREIIQEYNFFGNENNLFSAKLSWGFFYFPILTSAVQNKLNMESYFQYKYQPFIA
jgi:hypothetical protein